MAATAASRAAGVNDRFAPPLWGWRARSSAFDGLIGGDGGRWDLPLQAG